MTFRGSPQASGDDQPAHLPAGPARHRRRRRHERLRRRARPAARRAGHRGRHLHPRHRSALPPVVEAGDGVLVRHVHAGPFEGLTKGSCPASSATFAREVLRAEARAAGRPLRRHALALLALRPGRGAGPRPLGRAAGALHAHDGQGQERRARRRRHPRAGGPDHRRGAGGGGCGHADRQHRPRGPAAGRPVRRRAAPGRGRAPRRRPRRLPAAGQGEPPAPGSACPRTRTCCSSPAGSSRSRRPTCCCARSRSCSRATPELRSRLVVPVVGGPSGSGLEHPESLAQLATELGLDDVVRFVPPVAQAELARWCAAADAGRRAVVQRVVRPGRRRGAGQRHPGGRGRRRRAHHGGARRAQRPAGRGPRGPRLGRGAAPGAGGRRPARHSRPAPWRRPGASRGSTPPTTPWPSTAGPSLRGRRSRERRRRTRRMPLGWSAVRTAWRGGDPASRPRACSPSPCPARRSCRPPSASTSARTRWGCTRSCAATRTRTTSGSTAGC